MTTNCSLAVFNPLARTIVPSNLVWKTAHSTDITDVEIVARRVARKIEPAQMQESALEYLQGLLIYDPTEEEPYHLWEALPERFAEIRSKPGCSHAFRWALREVVYLRNESWASPYQSQSLNPQDGLITTRLYGMIEFLVEKAMLELDHYNLVQAIERKMQKRRKDAKVDQRVYVHSWDLSTVELAFFRDHKYPESWDEDLLAAEKSRVIRPADTYRAYGLALRYATEKLGSFAAKDALAVLMMATPLPVDELENPDWVDPYTGDPDPEYIQVRVKEVSGAGNDEAELPAMIQDLLDNMGAEHADAFQETLKLCGSSLEDYWMQFKEAQRSGYTEVPEPEEEQTEAEFDVVEKDFQFSQDLKVDYDEVEKLQKALAPQLDQIKLFIRLAAEEAAKAYAAGEKFDFVLHHVNFLRFPAVKELFRQMTHLACTCTKRADCDPYAHHPKDLMAVILPMQNAFGFLEEDLYQIRIPADHGYTMAHWFSIHGEEYLEQFQRDDVDYGDPEVNKKVSRRFMPRKEEPQLPELDEFTWKVVREQTNLYNQGEERRVKWDTENRWGTLIRKFIAIFAYELFMAGEPLHPEIKPNRPLQYKPDVKWHPAFVTAEVEAAILGDGGSQRAQAAGWNAWRNAIDPEANQEYLSLRQRGKNHREAMEAFWEIVKRNKNRIAQVNKNGVILKSGRQIDWGILLLKLKANEIPMTINDLSRFLDEYLLKNQWGTPQLRKYISDKISAEISKLPKPQSEPQPSKYAVDFRRLTPDQALEAFGEMVELMKSGGATEKELSKAHNLIERLLNGADVSALDELNRLNQEWEEKFLKAFVPMTIAEQKYLEAHPELWIVPHHLLPTYLQSHELCQVVNAPEAYQEIQRLVREKGWEARNRLNEIRRELERKYVTLMKAKVPQMADQNV